MHALAAFDELESRRLFATLTAGLTVATAVSASRPVKNWTIDLKAGQALYAAAGTSGDTAFRPQLVVIGPDGKTLARSAGGRGVKISRAAPVTGTYTVRVRDNAGVAAGDVSVTAVFTGSTPIVDGDDGANVVSGDRYFGSIGPGDLDVYRFDTASDAFVRGEVDKLVESSKVALGVAVLKPDGSVLSDNGPLDYVGLQGSNGITIGRRPRTHRGTYYAILYQSGVDASGQYALGASITPGPQSTTDPDTKRSLSGTEGTGKGSMALADVDVYRVTVAKGQQLNIATYADFAAAPDITILDSAGRDIGVDDNPLDGSTVGSRYALARPDVSGTLYVILVNSSWDPTPRHAFDYTLYYKVSKA